MKQVSIEKTCIALALALAVISSGGCDILRSEYRRTDAVNTGGAWNDASGYESVIRSAEGRWWLDFEDPVLNGLIARGLEAGTDLKSAARTLQIAAYRADIEDLSLLPTPSARLSSSKTWEHDGRRSPSSSASLGISYEIDLFGRLRAQRDAARFAYEAGYEDYRSVRLALTAQIASAYWKTAYLNDAMASELENVREYEELIRMARLKYDEGAISLYDYNRTRTQHLNARSSVENYRRQLQEATDDLLLLLGADSVSELETDPSSYTLRGRSVPDVRPGIPADILENRPDLRSAENSLKSKLADFDAGTLSFLPTLTLTGSAGAGSQALFRFFEDPYLSVAGALAAPFLNYRNLTLNRNVSKATYEKAVYDFEKTLRGALFEVKEYLVQLETGRARLENSARALALAQENDRHYRLWYESGKMSYGDFLDNRRTLRATTVEHLALLRDELETTAMLYKALGGAQK